MGVFDFLFGTGQGVNKADDPYGGVRNAFLPWLQSQIGQAGPSYQAPTVAPMSGEEQKSLGFLNQYGQQGYGQTFGNAKNEINKTLTDQYNPATSPYYQAVKAEAARNLKDTQENIASNAGGGGRYFSGARLKQQGEAATDTGIGLNKTLGELALQERQNRLGVLPQALQYATAEQQLPLQQAEAFQSLGALPRQIEQSQLTSNLEDWLRSNYEYPMQIAQMAQGTQQAPLYQQNPRGFVWDMLMAMMQGGSEGASKAMMMG